MENRNKISDFLWRVLLFIWALTIILPIFWIFYESLKTNIEFFQDIWKLPSSLQWNNYLKAWLSLGIGSSMLNTIFVVGMSMVLSLVITTLNAYVFSRLEWRGKNIIWGIFMLSLFLPGINVLVPNYILMRALHLTNNLGGLIIFYSLTQSIVDLMILVSFMKSIPKEMEESAYIDGASILRVVKDVIVPLSLPGIVTIAIFKFIGYYNDFLNPFIFLSDPKKYTIGVSMYQANQLMQYSSDWVTLLAGVIITIIPCIIVYMFFQKRIVEGATLGAIKG
jgi:ABC-type sugar transport system, permease component